MSLESKTRPARPGDILYSASLPGGGQATITAIAPVVTPGTSWDHKPQYLPAAQLRVALPTSEPDGGQIVKALRAPDVHLLSCPLTVQWGYPLRGGFWRCGYHTFHALRLADAVEQAKKEVSHVRRTLENIICRYERLEAAIQRSFASVQVPDTD